MNNDLEQLKEIVNGEGFDQESRDSVSKLEDALLEVLAAEKLAQHPVIANYLTFLKKDIVDCRLLLSDEHERLDETARSRLFERIRQCKQTLRAFGGDKQDLEAHIKQELERAISMKNE